MLSVFISNNMFRGYNTVNAKEWKEWMQCSDLLWVQYFSVLDDKMAAYKGLTRSEGIRVQSQRELWARKLGPRSHLIYKELLNIHEYQMYLTCKNEGIGRDQGSPWCLLADSSSLPFGRHDVLIFLFKSFRRNAHLTFYQGSYHCL